MKLLTEAERKATKRLLQIMSSQRISFGIGTIQESIARVERDTTIYSPRFLRRALLHMAGLRRSKGADNLIIFGCLSCFGQFKLILSYLELLDRLDVKYTFLRDSEYCCYAPSLFATFAFSEGERDEAEAASMRFIGFNIDQARDLGVKQMVNFCQACYFLAKHFYPNEKIGQKYHLDFLVDELKEKQLKIRPKRVLFFGGCWRRYRYIYPDVDFDVEGYRLMLLNIKGLSVIDCTSNMCCLTSKSAIFAMAKREEAEEIVTACVACHEQLETAACGKFKVKMIHEIVLEAVKYIGIQS